MLKDPSSSVVSCISVCIRVYQTILCIRVLLLNYILIVAIIIIRRRRIIIIVIIIINTIVTSVNRNIMGAIIIK